MHDITLCLVACGFSAENDSIWNREELHRTAPALGSRCGFGCKLQLSSSAIYVLQGVSGFRRAKATWMMDFLKMKPF